MNKVIALDLGSRTCGIAMSDVLGIAHGYENFRFQEGAYRQCIAHVIEVLHKEGVTEVALGYPLNMDGSAGDSAHRSERFKEQLLAEDPNLQITLVDERMTTVTAYRFMREANLKADKKKKIIDQQAAIVILEFYLERKELNQ